MSVSPLSKGAAVEVYVTDKEQGSGWYRGTVTGVITEEVVIVAVHEGDFPEVMAASDGIRPKNEECTYADLAVT